MIRREVKDICPPPPTFIYYFVAFVIYWYFWKTCIVKSFRWTFWPALKICVQYPLGPGPRHGSARELRPRPSRSPAVHAQPTLLGTVTFRFSPEPTQSLTTSQAKTPIDAFPIRRPLIHGKRFCSWTETWKNYTLNLYIICYPRITRKSSISQYQVVTTNRWRNLLFFRWGYKQKFYNMKRKTS